MKNHLSALGLAAIAVMSLASCSGLKKMAKKEPTVVYTVTPCPLEMHGDSVAVTVNVTYPAKYFAKKAVLTVTPEMGGIKFKSATLLGEKAQGTGTRISYKTGGSFTYTDKVAYNQSMDNANLVVKATGQVKSKSKDMPERTICNDIKLTPQLLMNTDKVILGADKFVKFVNRSAEGKIYYEINKSNVRPNEMKSEGMKPLNDFVALGKGKGFEFKGATISSYASPDGEMSMNANLAEERFTSAKGAMINMANDKKSPLPAAQPETFYTKQTTAEDWAGFQDLMSKSTIKDKEIILNVLRQYPDGEKREQEIKNIAAAYEEVARDILPQLRRSVITFNAVEYSRTDARILELARTKPDSLSVEEILYAATLTKDMSEKLTFYRSAERMYPNDWRTWNDVGCILLQQNKLQDAKAEFDKANSLSPNNPIVMNNLAICMRWMGDRKGAKEMLKKAGAAGPEVSYNLGIIAVQDGMYTDAVSYFGGNKDFNAALAQVLNGDLDGASRTLDASPDKESAMAYYLRAIIGARKGDKTMMNDNLRTAISKDGSLKAKAAQDAEFQKYKDDSDFKSITQ
ncbi:MAG: tetratricopeptide repeat protein [Bacteroidia bacterium]|jgi:Flp pilus assembly protein TadD|nr:tetratricopeptide repeat protein [Bacteroidia bacterium]